MADQPEHEFVQAPWAHRADDPYCWAGFHDPRVGAIRRCELPRENARHRIADPAVTAWQGLEDAIKAALAAGISVEAMVLLIDAMTAE